MAGTAWLGVVQVQELHSGSLRQDLWHSLEVGVLQHSGKDDITLAPPSPAMFPNVDFVSDGSTHVRAASLDVLEVDHSSRPVGLYTTSKSLG